MLYFYSYRKSGCVDGMIKKLTTEYGTGQTGGALPAWVPVSFWILCMVAGGGFSIAVSNLWTAPFYVEIPGSGAGQASGSRDGMMDQAADMKEEIFAEQGQETRETGLAQDAGQQETGDLEDLGLLKKETDSGDRLNYAYYYEDEADTGDVSQSFAGKIYDTLSRQDSSWLNEIYGLHRQSPGQVAGRLGMDKSAVTGTAHFNGVPLGGDEHRQEITSWNNVHVSFRNGDGTPVMGSSNKKEILAMASVYGFYGGEQDYGRALAYASRLWSASHSYKISVSSVYYCDGECLYQEKTERDGDDGIAAMSDFQTENGLGESGSAAGSDGAGSTSGGVGSISNGVGSGNVSGNGTGGSRNGNAQGDSSDSRNGNTQGDSSDSRNGSMQAGGDGGEGSGTGSVQDSGGSAGSGSLQEDGSGLGNGSAAGSGDSSGGDGSVLNSGGSAGGDGSGGNSGGSVGGDGSGDNSGSSVGGSGNGMDNSVPMSGSESRSNSGIPIGKSKGVPDISKAPEGQSVRTASQEVAHESGVNGMSAGVSNSLNGAALKETAALEIRKSVLVGTSMDGSELAAESESHQESAQEAGTGSGQGQENSADSGNAQSSSKSGSETESISGSGWNGESGTGQSESQGTETETTVRETADIFRRQNEFEPDDVTQLSKTKESSATAEGEASEEGSSGQENQAGEDSAETNKENTSLKTLNETSGNGKADKKDSRYCYGHVDLNISVTITGLDEKKNLYAIDPAQKGNDGSAGQWSGWGDQARADVKAIVSQDWNAVYGLSNENSLYVQNALSTSEIAAYMNLIPEGTSAVRKQIARQALMSVGCIPYYWGGKPSRGGFDGNGFGTVVAPDNEGRILKGLDCSGWINWVYWTVRGASLPAASTSGLMSCGKGIAKQELQAGDILIRAGEEPHVYLFLAWAENGSMYLIHETTGNVNNVTIGIYDLDLPYYRCLVNE